MSRKLAPSLLAICCALSPLGCIPVPLALRDPEPFAAERMTSIQIGQTTRDDVRALLANWTYQTDDGVQTAHLEPQASEGGRYWVFGLPRQLGQTAWVGLIDPGVTGLGDNYEDHWVLFEFDDDATVARFWIADDKTRCAVGGACYHDSYLQLVADEAPDSSSPASTAASDGCVVYAYASDDFELPLAVSDGTHDGWLFAKGSFVRFDVATGSGTPSAWYANIPASQIAMPIDCAGSEGQYLALRPHEGSIEAMSTTPSTGERAIEKGYPIERLVAAQASVPSRPPSIWTNCTAADPCRELATLDTPSWGLTVTSIVDAHEQSNKTADYGLLHPGRYTVESRFGFGRHDTFDMRAGHRYEMRYRQERCRGAPKDRCTPESADGTRSTLWFEDAATKRVVVGQKWCSSDADCPESQCSVQAGNPPVCDIPELQCTYGQGCIPR